MLTKSGKIPRAALLPVVLCSGLGLGACSPYPDDGEFAAGIVFSANFLSGVKTLRTLPASGRNRGTAAPLPYTILASSGTSAAAVATATPASSPLWTDNGKRDPLAIASAQPVYVFDNEKNCAAPEDAPAFDPRWDLFDKARQYPVFSDLPEVLTGMGGRAGRTGAYSAIVEVVHVATPAGFACQSVKRADTVKSRAEADLKPVGGQREYRLLLIIDTALTIAPMPFQLGWFNQLLVPYVDMGPVPLDADGQHFATMPVYNVVPMGAMSPALRVVPGAEGDTGPMGPALSPICRDYTLTVPTAKDLPPTDVNDAAFKAATATTALSACLVCFTTGDGYQCPLSTSRAGAR